MNPTPTRLDRREFLQKSSALGAGLAVVGTAGTLSAAAKSANDKLVVAVIGLGRGRGHIGALLDIPNTEIAYVCDVDKNRHEAALKQISDKKAKTPQAVTDLRKILDDGSVDAVFIATCNHWHAPATIRACAANKHVYVEKPGSHNPREGELMVEAARRYDRVVQMGNQRRSWPGVIEGIEKVKGGAIGKVTFARCWYNNLRPSIGHGKKVPVPSNLDYSLWQGPAPEKPYVDNLVHYNWHWRWHWGNGELGNNGIHALDVARWGLDVDYPTRVTYIGSRFCHEDDQETPDTGVAQYHFGEKGCTWEGSSCHPRRSEGLPFVSFYGDQGTLDIADSGYKVYDIKGKLVDQGSGDGGDRSHIANFLDCIRTGATPNSEIEIGQKSTLLGHLGNIAYRLGKTIDFDPEKRKITNAPEAEELWSREYRKGWEPKV